MAKDNEQKKAQDQLSQEESVAIRYSLQSAYTFVDSQRNNQSFYAFTPEEAHDRFIERVEGQGTTLRPNLLARIDRVVQNVSATIAKVKAMPAEAFRKPDENDVNYTEET